MTRTTQSRVFYLQDCFFYSLVYDPQQKTLLADKGEIRVGSKFQAQVNHFPRLKEGEWANRTKQAPARKYFLPNQP